MENSIEDMLTNTMMYRVKSYHERIMISTKEGGPVPKVVFLYSLGMCTQRWSDLTLCPQYDFHLISPQISPLSQTMLEE